MNQVISAFLYLLSFVFAVVALQGLLVPTLLVLPVEIQLGSPASFAEIRAGYGGCFGGLAFLFGVGARRVDIRKMALTVAATVLGLFSMGRFLSLGIEGVPNSFSIVIHVAESLACLVALVLAVRIRAVR